LALKKDAKLELKVRESLAKASQGMVEDKKKEAERTQEAADAEAVENKEKEDLALKKAKLAEFEEKKKEADMKVTKEFAD